MGTLTAPFYPSAALRDRVQEDEAPAGRRRRYARRARRAGVVIRIVGPGGHPPRQTGRGAHHRPRRRRRDRKSTRLNSSHLVISYAVFCLKKKKHAPERTHPYLLTLDLPRHLIILFLHTLEEFVLPYLPADHPVFLYFARDLTAFSLA